MNELIFNKINGQSAIVLRDVAGAVRRHSEINGQNAIVLGDVARNLDSISLD